MNHSKTEIQLQTPEPLTSALRRALPLYGQALDQQEAMHSLDRAGSEASIPWDNIDRPQQGALYE